MTYAIVRTDKMFGTQNKAGLASFKFVEVAGNTITPLAIENGNVVKIDGLMDDSREVYKAVAPAANTEKKDVLLVADPEVLVCKKYHSLGDFINEAGEVVRGYYLHTNDIFSVTAEALSGNPAKDKLVELMAGTKLKVVDSNTNGSTLIGKIIAEENVGTIKYFVIQVA